MASKLAVRVNKENVGEHLIERTDRPNLQFVGALLVSIDNRKKELPCVTTLSVYKTLKGAIVCQTTTTDPLLGDTVVAQVVPESELTMFFGFGELAKELYAVLNVVDGVVEVVE